MKSEKSHDLLPGERVRVYGIDSEGVWNDGVNGEVVESDGGPEIVIVYANGQEVRVHPKQCRRLVSRAPAA